MQEGKKGGVGYVPMHHTHLSHPKDASSPPRHNACPPPHTFFSCPLDCQYVAQLGPALTCERVNGVIGKRVDGGNGKRFSIVLHRHRYKANKFAAIAIYSFNVCYTPNITAWPTFFSSADIPWDRGKLVIVFQP